MFSDVRPFRPWKLLALLVVPLLALAFAQSASANSLTQYRVVVGQVVLSEDACGTSAAACTVDIVKPSPLATVRHADLFCATVPFGYVPEPHPRRASRTRSGWDRRRRWRKRVAHDRPGRTGGVPRNRGGHAQRRSGRVDDPNAVAAAPGVASLVAGPAAHGRRAEREGAAGDRATRDDRVGVEVVPSRGEVLHSAVGRARRLDRDVCRHHHVRRRRVPLDRDRSRRRPADTRGLAGERGAGGVGADRLRLAAVLLPDLGLGIRDSPGEALEQACEAIYNATLYDPEGQRAEV